MKIGLVCSHGGHLTEMLALMGSFEGKDVFFITYDTKRTRLLSYPKHFVPNIETSPIRMFISLIRVIKILRQEKPDIILSTGSEITIPTFFIAWILHVKTIYIESWCRISTPTMTGRLVYPISSIFLVQWPKMQEVYGKKAKFLGSVVS